MFKKALLTVAVATMLVIPTANANDKSYYPDEYVQETFRITSVTDTEIKGDIIKGLTGEGIYLLPSDVHIPLKVGDTILVTYDAEDYSNSIWDNILGIEIVH